MRFLVALTFTAVVLSGCAGLDRTLSYDGGWFPVVAEPQVEWWILPALALVVELRYSDFDPSESFGAALGVKVAL